MRGEAMPAIKGFMFDLDGTLLLSDRKLGVGFPVLRFVVGLIEFLRCRTGGIAAGSER